MSEKGPKGDIPQFSRGLGFLLKLVRLTAVSVSNGMAAMVAAARIGIPQLLDAVPRAVPFAFFAERDERSTWLLFQNLPDRKLSCRPRVKISVKEGKKPL